MSRKMALLFLGSAFLLVSCATVSPQAKEAKAPAPASPSPQNYTEPATGMEFVLVKAGCYDMGDVFGGGDSDERPAHEVCVNDFYIGKYEVTQDQWKTVMGNNPARFTACGGNCPVETVSWYNAQQYVRMLNQKTGRSYRLPTEAEWEFAARSGGKREKWAGTNNEAELGDYAWYSANSGKQTNPVGRKKPNGLGLYDMTGNVWEWVSDLYDGSYYANSPKKNPRGPGSSFFDHCVLRGGSWDAPANDARAGRRFNHGKDRMDNEVGLRLVMTP